MDPGCLLTEEEKKFRFRKYLKKKNEQRQLQQQQIQQQQLQQLQNQQQEKQQQPKENNSLLKLPRSEAKILFFILIIIMIIKCLISEHTLFHIPGLSRFNIQL
jgi:hypothetical protein